MLMNARSIDASAKLDHLYIFPDPENNLIKYLKGFSQQQTNICLKVMTHAERQSPRPMHKMNPCASKLICQDVTPSCAGVGAPSASTSPPSPALHQSDRERETYAFWRMQTEWCRTGSTGPSFVLSLLRCGSRLKCLRSPALCLCGLDHNWFACLLMGRRRPAQEITGPENIRASADKVHSASWFWSSWTGTELAVRIWRDKYWWE